MKTKAANKTPNKKEDYVYFCEKEPNIPIFSRPFWLDKLCGADNWDVSLVYRGDKVVAAMPYMTKCFLGMLDIRMPPLTPKLGPWIASLDGKRTTIIEREIEYLNDLISGLPNFTSYNQSWDFKYKNWLPFYWKGFNQTTCYTYRIEATSDFELLKSNLRENLKREFRKATKRYNLKIENAKIEEVIELNRMTFNRQGRRPPDSETIIKSIFELCCEQGCGMALVASDGQGIKHATALVVWDNNCMYYLVGGGNPKLRNSGASTALLLHCIQKSCEMNLSFDFEGSMIPAIEKFFRGFGGQLIEYYSVRKSNSRLWDLYIYLRPWLKKNYLRMLEFRKVLWRSK